VAYDVGNPGPDLGCIYYQARISCMSSVESSHFFFFYSFIDVCNFETDGDFAHKTDCDKYYTCKEGIPTPKTCAPGQFFSRTSRQCDSYENVDCVVNDEGGMCTMISEYVYSTCNKIG
jgi:hypothetical protein